MRPLVILALWTVVIPDVCLEPLLRVWERTTPWAMQVPYEQLLSTGRLDIGGGCEVGLTTEASIQVPLPALVAFSQEYRKDQTRSTLAGWLDTFLREGRVVLPGEIVVAREGET